MRNLAVLNLIAKRLNTAMVKKQAVGLVAGDEAFAWLKNRMGKKWRVVFCHGLSTSARAVRGRAEFVRRHAKKRKAAGLCQNVCFISYISFFTLDKTTHLCLCRSFCRWSMLEEQ